MKDRNIILKQTPLFQGIKENDYDFLLKCLSAREQEYKKDTYIFMTGNPVTEVGIVLSGSVNIINEDYWGNRTIISKMSVGEMFGEAFSYAEITTLPVSVVAVENTRILFINYKQILTNCASLCTFHANLIHNMVRILAYKNIALTRKIEHTSRRTTRDKLLSYLSAQAITAKRQAFDIPFNRQELADYLSVDRSAMSNELCKLRDEGVLAFHKNHFELL